MSLAIHVSATTAVDIEAVRERVVPPFEMVELVPGTEGGDWPEEALVYSDERASRPIETEYDRSNGFVVRILPGASAEDCYLGFRIAEAVGALTDSPVQAEDADTAMSANAFGDVYDRTYAERRAREMTEFIIHDLVETQGETAELPILTRTLGVGPGLVADIKRYFDDAVAGLWARSRQLNFPDAHALYEPPVMVIENRRPKGLARVVVYGPGVPMLIPKDVQRVHVLDDDYTALQVTPEDVTQSLGSAVYWLSEDVVVLPEIAQGEPWQSLLERLRPLHIDGYEPHELAQAGATSNLGRICGAVIGWCKTKLCRVTL